MWQSIKTTTVITAVFGILMISNGCASSASKRVSDRDQTAQSQDVRRGYGERVRKVVPDESQPDANVASDAARSEGGGDKKGLPRLADALGSGILGGLLGSTPEHKATPQSSPTLEITVELDGGRMVALTQPADQSFYPGDRVKLLVDQTGAARVAHYY